MNRGNSPYLTPQEFRCRSMLESFRLGVVPNRRIEEFTFGRDAAIATINTWLDRQDIGTLLVKGAYGSGKSHLLEYIRARAANQGYAVATANLDPNDAPPSKPKAVFRKLLHSFRYLEGQTPKRYEDFMRECAKRAHPSHFSDSGWIRGILQLIGTPYEQRLWNWLEGYGYVDEAPTLYDHGTAANIYCNILSGLGWIAVSILRLKGLVVILDEGENVDSYYYYRYQVEKGFNLIQGLALVANNDRNLLNESISRDYSRPGIGTLFGDKTDLIYHGYNQMRYCYRLPAFLKVAFAFATELADEDTLRLYNLPKYDILLDALPEKALREIFNYIFLLYSTAYNCSEDKSKMGRCFEIVNNRTGRGNRSFVKGSVELLDIKRSHPDLPIEQIE